MNNLCESCDLQIKLSIKRTEQLIALILPKMPWIDGRLISRHGEVSGVV